MVEEEVGMAWWRRCCGDLSEVVIIVVVFRGSIQPQIDNLDQTTVNIDFRFWQVMYKGGNTAY